MQQQDIPSVTTRSGSMVAEDQESSSVAELLDEAQRNKEHNVLNLNYKGLVQFPSQLTGGDDFSHVQVIYAKRNLLAYLPTNINMLASLKVLYLHSNSLSSLPEELSGLSHLESLDVSQNHFTVIPDVVFRCSSLRKLFFTTNQLTTVPPEIAQLKQLTLLNLMDNHLQSLPQELGHCCSLETLQLDRNKLQHLPRQLALLGNLKELSASANRLTALPMGFGMLPNLQHLYVDNNPGLGAIPFTLYTKPIGVTRCGSVQPQGERCILSGELFGVLPSEIQVYYMYDETTKVEQPNTLLELAYRTVHRHKDILAINSLPRHLADLVEVPTAYCVSPSSCNKHIFTWTYVHLLQIPWVQDYTLGGNDNVSLMGLCCSRKCLQVFQRHPIPL